MIDQQVDAIAPLQRVVVVEGLRRLAGMGLAAAEEQLDMRQRVPAHLLEEVLHALDIGPGGLELVDQEVGGEAGGVVVEAVQPLAHLLHPDRRPGQRLAQALLQLGDRGLDGLALGLGQLLELLRRQHPALAHRRQRQSHGRAHQRHLPPPGLGLDRAHRLLLALLQLLLDHLAAGAVLLVVEGRAQRVAKVADELGHVGLQPRPPPGGEVQRARLPGIGQVAEIAPVPGRRLAGGVGAHAALDHGVLADALRPEREQVEAVAADRQPDLERLVRPLLADRPVEIGQLGRAGDAEQRLVAVPAQLGGGQGLRRHAAPRQ